MRVATSAYPLDFLDDWAAYAAKLTDWVRRAAAEGAELVVFPEYGAMELATLAGREVAQDLERSLHAVSDLLGDADDLHAELARRFGVHILAASAPCFDGQARPVNRARLFAPTGGRAAQDKQIMTRFERESWDVRGGAPLTVFDTALGKLGILICYDAEFPLLGHALAEADVILVPSCTDALAGYTRVRVGARARALENQCFTVMSSTVGTVDWSPAVDENTGCGGIFCPPDLGLPADGIVAEGRLNAPGWTFASLDLALTERVRRDGAVLNAAHWGEQVGRDGAAPVLRLR